VAAEAPSLWIIAGANGSGKSSAYSKVTIDAPEGSIWIINPDALSAQVADHEQIALNPDANLAAVQRIEDWLYASISAYQTVGVETVLSSPKYRNLVSRAHENGFRVRLIYVVLDSVELNVERVRIRVAKGGHDVPEDKIRERRLRSLEQLSWFFDHADLADIFDNSGAEPTLVVSKRGDDVLVFGEPIPEVVEALERVLPGLTEHLANPAPADQPAARPRRRRRRRRSRSGKEKPRAFPPGADP
jgi:predicted ABC-type ATPase